MTDHLTVDAHTIGADLIRDAGQAIEEAAAMAGVLGESLFADALGQQAQAADGLARLLRQIARDVGRWTGGQA